MEWLYRSGTEQMPCGVCGELAEHIDVDPIIIRLIRVVITLLSPGIVSSFISLSGSKSRHSLKNPRSSVC